MFSSSEINRFKTICSSFVVDLSAESIEKFETYTSLLLQWNRRIHLVSKRDATNDRILRHFVDSLSIFKVVDISTNANILDLGAGAGFPSVPIKIVRNDVWLTLAESTHKKALFLHKLIQSLELEQVRVLDQRAETLSGHTDTAGRFDLITAKAVGELSSSVQLSAPLLKPGGALVAYKGRGAKKEIAEIRLPPEYVVADVTRIKIPEIDLIRWLILVRKVS